MREYNKVGLIGLGVMGYGMAENLLKAGYTLIACDVNQERIKMLPMQEKVVAVDKPCDILKHTNTVITMLPNSPHVLEVLEGLVNAAQEEKWVRMTTTCNRPDALPVDFLQK